MAYTYNPTDWKTGDIITEGKLNNIENGISKLYPKDEVILPPQVITIDETTPEQGVELSLPTGESIDNDLWASGGYYIVVEKIDTPTTTHELIIPLNTQSVDRTTGFISYEYETQSTDIEDNSQWSFFIVNNIVAPHGLYFYVGRFDDGIMVPVFGSYRISIVLPGYVNFRDCVCPKLLIHNDNESFLWTNYITVGEGQGYLVDPDIISLNYVPKSILFDGRLVPFGSVRPTTYSPQDTSYGGFVLTDWCMGLEADANNGSSFALIPNTAFVEYISENIGG